MGVRKKIHEELFNELNENITSLKGVWSLFYIEGTKKLKTLDFYIKKAITPNYENSLRNTEIDIGFGSNGCVFEEFMKDKNKKYIFLKNTFNDPRGTVIKLDIEIEQHNTCFYSIRNLDDKVIGVIDIFGTDNLDTYKEKILEILDKYKFFFILLIEKQNVINLQNVFNNDGEPLKYDFTSILYKFLELNNQLDIPYLYLEENRESPEIQNIVFNEQILKLIEYELKFCSYLKTKPTGYKILEEFFFGVVKEFIFSYTEELDLNGNKVKIKIYTLKGKSKDSSISELKISFPKILTSSTAKGVAKEKYLNESIIEHVSKKISLKEIVFYIIYKIEPKAPLIKNSKDLSNEKKYFEKIRPSNFLPYYYNQKYKDDELLEVCTGLKDFKYLKWEEDHGKAEHILFIKWNKKAFFKLLRNYLLKKNSSEIKKLLEKFFLHDSKKSNSFSLGGITFMGIDNEKINGSPIAKNFIDSNLKNYLLELEKNKTLKHATRAAISQVMARNMSHNIGSHVLSKLLKNSQIHGIYKPEQWQCKNDDGKKAYASLLKSKGVDNCNYKLLANFFSYLKSRMDFLADVTTSTPVIENTMGIYNDIVKEFIQNRVLNDRISGISKFEYEIMVCKPTNNGLDCKKTATDGCDCIISENKNKDIKVAVPNDVLGCHALYTILENILRNTAKHGKNKEIEIKIKIEEASNYTNKNTDNLNLNEYYAVSIFDNCNYAADIDTNDWSKDNKEKYKDLIKEEKIKKINKLVYDLNKKLSESILNSEGQLRHGAWGLIEMAASAAYLRKISINKIDSDDYKVKDLNGKELLSVNSKLCVLQAYTEQGKYLGYRFFMYKPREILIINGGSDEEVLGMPNGKKEQYKANGIWIKSKKEIDNDIVNKTIFPHKLVVIVGVNNGDLYLYNAIKNNPCFTKRIFIKNSFNFPENIDIEAFKNDIWQCYFENSKLFFYSNRSFKGCKTLKGKKSVVDSHGKNYCQLKFGRNESDDTPHDFVEIETSATKHFFKDTPKWFQRLKHASWPIKMLVLDERIQDFAYKETYDIERGNEPCNSKGECYHEDGVPYHLIYKNTNITVPNNIEECDLNAQNFYDGTSSEYKNIIKVISSFINDNKDNQYFIVIHLGIIEKLIAAYNKNHDKQNYNKDDTVKTAEFIKEQILKTENKDAYDNIVVTSGRGTPHNIPSNIRYLNFSIISQYLITLRNKYAFTEALYSARKTKKKYQYGK